MATTQVAPGAPYPPSQNAAQKPYDPVNTVQGMFNGSVVRIAYALKDPKKLSESTKLILAECTKKYQDALDDCEIQILDAKWYLERKLAENKARREAEAKAKEASTATITAKRKYDEVEDATAPQQPETPSKRPKSSEQLPTPSQVSALDFAATDEAQKNASISQKPSQPGTQSQISAAQRTNTKETSIPKEPDKPKEEDKKQPLSQSQSEQQFNTDDFIQASPQATSALTNDDFQFQSMFGEPTDDNNDAINDNEDIDFDFDIDSAFASNTNNTSTVNNTSNTNTQLPSQSQQQNDPSSLNSLLPGLEQFANQPDDSQNTGITSQPMQNQASNTSFGGNFEPNVWDDLLNDETFGTDGDNNANMNMNFDNADMDNIGVPDKDLNFDDLFGGDQ